MASTSIIDPPKNRPGKPSSGSEQLRTADEARETRSTPVPTPPPRWAEEGARAETKKPPEEATTPRTTLAFKPDGRSCPEGRKAEVSTNPFASPTNACREGDTRARGQKDELEGWSFQGRKKHIPTLAPPRQDTRSDPPRTPQQEPTSGGKRAQFHSEVHHSYFSSLGIDIPSNGEPFRARIWPVLTREKNSNKETLVFSKNQTRPSLPISLRIMGPADAEWTQDSAWEDLT